MLNACQNKQRISQNTLLGVLDTLNPVRIMLESIPVENWAIVSFDPRQGNACVRINNGKRVVILDVFIPSVTVI